MNCLKKRKRKKKTFNNNNNSDIALANTSQVVRVYKILWLPWFKWSCELSLFVYESMVKFNWCILVIRAPHCTVLWEHIVFLLREIWQADSSSNSNEWGQQSMLTYYWFRALICKGEKELNHLLAWIWGLIIGRTTVLTQIYFETVES